MDYDFGARRITAIGVLVGDQEYDLLAMTAQAWIDALFPEDGWTDIVPGLLTDADDLDDALIDGTLDEGELRTASHAAITAAAGVNWYVAWQLVNLSRRPEVGGELVLRGVDPATLSLGAYVLACYQVATRNMDRKQIGEFDMLLNQPPTGADPDEWFDEETAGRGFLAAMAAAAR